MCDPSYFQRWAVCTRDRRTAKASGGRCNCTCHPFCLYLSLSVSVHLSVSLCLVCLCLSVSLSLSVCLSVCLSVSLSLSVSLFPFSPPPPSLSVSHKVITLYFQLGAVCTRIRCTARASGGRTAVSTTVPVPYPAPHSPVPPPPLSLSSVSVSHKVITLYFQLGAVCTRIRCTGRASGGRTAVSTTVPVRTDHVASTAASTCESPFADSCLVALSGR